jgi:hypothetical protein
MSNEIPNPNGLDFEGNGRAERKAQRAKGKE